MKLWQRVGGSGARRDSVHGEPPEVSNLSEEEKALQEGFNSFLQLKWVEAALPEVISTPPPKSRYLQRHLIEELDAIALNRLSTHGGRLRAGSMKIRKSRHKPPAADRVSVHLDELCNYVNDNWEESTPLHLAAYVLWRLNWIHPFVDGNGRTARALAYYVLCARLGRARLPGAVTIPELIALDREPYYRALEAADRAFKESEQIDLSVMESYLEVLYTEQLRETVPADHGVVAKIKERRATWLDTAGRRRESQVLFGGRYETAMIIMGVVSGLLTLGFFMYFGLQPGSVDCDRRFPVVVVLAVGMALASGCMSGFATAKGVIPIQITPGNVLKVAVTGGFAVLVICLLLGNQLYQCDDQQTPATPTKAAPAGASK